MNKLKQLCRNIRFLMKHDLRHETTSAYMDLSGYAREIATMSRTTPVPKVMDIAESLELLTTSDLSLSRFGDGEFRLMCGRGIPFQDADETLAVRLKQVLSNPPLNCATAIGRSYWYADSDVQLHCRRYAWEFMKKYASFMNSLVPLERNYCDTSMSQFYHLLRPDYDFAKLFLAWRNLWQGKDLLIVCGKGVLDKLNNDVFDTARSIEYLYGPSKNAWKSYDELFFKIKTIANGRLIVLILGPTATVLASDLASIGIRALDVGHLAKDYDAFCKRMPTDWEHNVKFFMPD